MRQFFRTLFLAFLLISPGWSQEEPQDDQASESEPVAAAADDEVAAAADPVAEDDDEGEAESPPEDPAETVVADGAPEIDDSDLDEQTYEEDEDDFVPSEEIPTDESIPFPSNI